ncbi:MAG TPA: peptidylprolyl isomerase [Dongiaceae bacterium]|nr:peptidylprolyl isomerase [Dongiaceae bacterium]
MRISWLLCVLLGTLAWGQAAPSAPPSQPAPAPASAPKPQAPADTSASVPDDAAVLTITGVCAPKPQASASKGATTKPAAAKTTASSTADCKTIITKAEFEKLANAVAPNPTPQQKKQLAGVLPRIIAMSTEAKKRGMDKTDQYNEYMKFVKMQVLTNQLQRKLQEDAAKISDADIEKYYKDNSSNFEQYNLDRIFVPRTKQVEAEAKDEDQDDKLSAEQKKAKEDAEKTKAEENEKAMTKLADDLRARAAAGEDVVKLQKEAFDAAGMKIESPTVNLPNIRRTGLPPAHAAVFELKPGELSQVISDNGGHYIYKMIGKTTMPLDQAKNEIRGKIQNDRMREQMEKLNSSFQSTPNEAYFGPGGVGPMPPPRMPRPRPGMPPASPAAQPGPAGAPSTTPPPAQAPAPQKD